MSLSNQIEAGRRTSLVPFFTTNISIILEYKEHDQDSGSLISVF